MACARECPGNRISETKTVKVNLAGHEVEWGDIDLEKCDDTFYGGMRTNDESIGGIYDGRKNITRGWHTPFFKRPTPLYNSGQAICGARGCTRACMMSLEARGVLKNQFKQPFRRRRPWQVDWSDPEVVGEENVLNPKKVEGIEHHEAD